MIFLQPPTWAQRLFKEDRGDVVMTKPQQSTSVKTAASEICSTIPPIPSCAFPNNSKAASMQQHNRIPGLFTIKTALKSNRPMKRKQETIPEPFLGKASTANNQVFSFTTYYPSGLV